MSYLYSPRRESLERSLRLGKEIYRETNRDSRETDKDRDQ